MLQGQPGAGRPARCTSVPPVTAQEFLAAFAAQIGVAAPTAQEFDTLLEVAAIAAHASERVAAPLACWLGGTSALPAADLLAAARAVATAPEGS